MDLGLRDAVAFVAGASAGLGYAAAKFLLQNECRVAICSRSPERIDSAAARLAEESDVSDARVLAVTCDVTDGAQVASAIEETVGVFGRLNILVTNAGGPPSGQVGEFGPEDFRRAIELNMISAISLVQAARPHLERAARDDDHARIIMVTSLSAKQPIPSLVLSNTARAGLQGYAKTLAEEVGPLGITVNTVLPGYTETERLNELAEVIQAKTGQSVAEIREGWVEQNALKRLGSPDEFGAAVAFLASKHAAYITGVALPIDGGRSKHLL
jgi:3-oxoacyl-[acyl-carrier protein] reductase